MGKLMLVTGGVRSGKSSLAQCMAADSGRSAVCYLATAEALDDEMRDRIARHRQDRPPEWRTVEESRDPAGALAAMPGDTAIVIVDCLTLYLTNLLMDAGEQEFQSVRSLVLDRIREMLAVCDQAAFDTIIVSNEVGMGIVPDSLLGRSFRDLAGEVNRMTAAAAAEVWITVAGIPLKLKG
ncbi:MAG: bifunctional adenosylcobinamide kinase/adenosylcobinamide-phosphate guanylyltransferase [bacterium]|nr:bifunctional adenosylcobinamide kinase/adenosylcobinamide-phosphate guanylyltransferase [bacterium]